MKRSRWNFRPAMHRMGPLLRAAMVAVCLLPLRTSAGTRPQVDLSVSVSMTPMPFAAGGRGTFTITVHNAGPDAAGTAFPELKPVRVFGNSFIVTSQSPPFELVNVIEGDCWLDRWISEPLPDGNIALAFDYYFGSIPAGESLSCTSDIEFYPSTHTSVSTSWWVHSVLDDDTYSANDRFSYVLEAQPESVPASSPISLLILGLGFLLTAGLCERAVRQRTMPVDKTPLPQERNFLSSGKCKQEDLANDLALSWIRRRGAALLAGICTSILGSIQATAGTPAQVDLSLSVVVSPETFVPSGRNTIALTVRNDGPDVAGGNTSSSIDVYGEGYIVTTQPPPYEVVEPIEGCWVERFVTEPLPDNNIGLLFAYYFDSIPAGHSRTCTYDIEFYPSTSAPLTLTWQVDNWYTDIDTDSSNDTLDYTLVAAPALSPSEPVPVLSRLGWLTLGLGFLLTGCMMRGRVSP